MGTLALVLPAAAAEAFLLHCFLQFRRDRKKDRAARQAAGCIGSVEVERRSASNVIEIEEWKWVPHRGSRRIAS